MRYNCSDSGTVIAVPRFEPRVAQGEDMELAHSLLGRRSELNCFAAFQSNCLETVLPCSISSYQASFALSYIACASFAEKSVMRLPEGPV